MPSKKESRPGASSPSHPEIQGFLGEGASLTGEIVLQGGFRIDGRLVGRVRSPGTLVIGPTGDVESEELRVGSLSVSGCVRGDLHVVERLEIHAGGRVQGTVTLSRPGLVITPGGCFDGVVRMTGEGAPAGKPEPPQAPAAASSDPA
jgi:cytoskeletal protein CcmA (bactofilin family)